ncbi:hypothetical protein N7490_004223 [Penicillium lividum]|nr:hypothetical protein N7490_004223 [Penicillium lividum]
MKSTQYAKDAQKVIEPLTRDRYGDNEIELICWEVMDCLMTRQINAVSFTEAQKNQGTGRVAQSLPNETLYGTHESTTLMLPCSRNCCGVAEAQVRIRQQPRPRHYYKRHRGFWFLVFCSYGFYIEGNVFFLRNPSCYST